MYLNALKELSETKAEACAVCWHEFSVKEELVTLPCLHTYHKECVDQWFCDEKLICPYCRKETAKFIEGEQSYEDQIKEGTV
jgi:hypothetical protein